MRCDTTRIRQRTRLGPARPSHEGPHQESETGNGEIGLDRREVVHRPRGAECDQDQLVAHRTPDRKEREETAERTSSCTAAGKRNADIGAEQEPGENRRGNENGHRPRRFVDRPTEDRVVDHISRQTEEKERRDGTEDRRRPMGDGPRAQNQETLHRPQ